MPFPQMLLNDNESVVLDLRPHWWSLVSPIAFASAAVLATIIAPAFLGGFGDVGRLVLLGVTAIALLGLVAAYLRWTTTNFVVTTDRLVYRSGIIAKRGMEIPLERVTNIAFSQTIFERMLRAGDLLIESAGEGGQQVFFNIEHPERVQNEIYRQMELAAGRDHDRMAGRNNKGPEESIPDQIYKLDQLRKRGVLSDQEFQEQKTTLLRRM